MQKHLTPEDRLDILRSADTWRKWSSLDDRRICSRCNQFISGRQIEIKRDQRGRFHLHCPTPGCESTAQDWFYQGSAAAAEPSQFHERPNSVSLFNIPSAEQPRFQVNVRL